MFGNRQKLLELIVLRPYIPEAGSTSAKVLPALHSEVFDVMEGGRHSSQGQIHLRHFPLTKLTFLDARARETINYLRAIGADV